MPEDSALRVMICGGENAADTGFVQDCLDRLHKRSGVSLIIEDGTFGAARFARHWARAAGIPVQTHERDGLNAQPTMVLQHRAMIAQSLPTAAIAFQGGENVMDMIRQLQVYGLKIWTPAPPEVESVTAPTLVRRGIVPQPEQHYEMAV